MVKVIHPYHVLRVWSKHLHCDQKTMCCVLILS